MGIILTLTGPSGVGKTTIAKQLLQRNHRVKLVQSVTTRRSRPSDMLDEYRHVSPGEFDTLSRRGVFLWTTDYTGLHYGTQKDVIGQVLRQKNAIGVMLLVPDVLPLLEGYLEKFSDKLSLVKVFVTAPRAVLEQRLVARGDEAKSIRRKLSESSSWETLAKYAKPPFHFVSNDRLIQQTVAEVEQLLAVCSFT